jgi:hypothetical protein
VQKDPLKCAWYADFAEYCPFSVHRHQMESGWLDNCTSCDCPHRKNELDHLLCCRHSPKALVQFWLIRSSATVFPFLQASLNKFGARSLRARPSNHEDSQNKGRWPSPSETVVLILKNCLSIALHDTSDPTHDLSGSTHWYHNHLSRALFLIPTKQTEPAGSGTCLPDRFGRKPVETGQIPISNQIP